jgi:hypothetical protein
VCSSSRPAVCSRQAILPPTESRGMEAISLASIRCFASTGIVHLITSSGQVVTPPFNFRVGLL